MKLISKKRRSIASEILELKAECEKLDRVPLRIQLSKHEYRRFIRESDPLGAYKRDHDRKGFMGMFDGTPLEIV